MCSNVLPRRRASRGITDAASSSGRASAPASRSPSSRHRSGRPPRARGSSCASCGPWPGRSRAGTTTRATPGPVPSASTRSCPSTGPRGRHSYLGDARADQTPWNQERVAFGKIRDLYRWLGSWKRVAYWWLTGEQRGRGDAAGPPTRAATCATSCTCVGALRAMAGPCRPGPMALGTRRLASFADTTATPAWHRRAAPGRAVASCATASCSVSTRGHEGERRPLDRRRDRRWSTGLAAADGHAAGGAALERGPLARRPGARPPRGASRPRAGPAATSLKVPWIGLANLDDPVDDLGAGGRDDDILADAASQQRPARPVMPR